MAASPLVAMVLGVYLGGAARVRRRWPPARTVAFASGAVVVAAALLIDGRRSFTAHAGQHLLLGMAAPALFALGAPVTLALQATRGAGRRRLLRVLHSRPAAVLCSPLVVWALFGGSMMAVYLTPLYRLSLDDSLVHELLHVHFLVVGALFFWPVLGVDPLPRRLPHGARLLMVFLTIPFHAVLGIALLGASPLAPGHTVADHRAGTGLLWAAGDLLGLVAVLIVAFQWMGHEERQAAREDRRADEAARAATGSGPAP
ncbi:MAG TPA: cytochrome c oxidase assembly protein [Acidimicrobiales bacterium]|nr:cytochrome c oxidase assembly protein [Acidimicrobiales bacterium]